MTCRDYYPPDDEQKQIRETFEAFMRGATEAMGALVREADAREEGCCWECSTPLSISEAIRTARAQITVPPNVTVSGPWAQDDAPEEGR